MKKCSEKMTFCDLKKMALMGLAGGLLVSATGLEAGEQGNGQDLSKFDSYLAGGSCGGGGRGMSYSYGSSCSAAGYYAPQSGCQGQPYYAPQGEYQGRPYYAPQGCQSQVYNAPQGQEQIYYNPQSGCAQASANRNYSQPQSGCSGERRQQIAANQDQPQGTWSNIAETSMNPNEGIYDEKGRPIHSNTPVDSRRQNSSQNQGYSQNPKMSATSKPLSESELLSQLNPQSRAAYQALSQDGKSLALQLANQDCKGKNGCKGMNSCKGSSNSCAGRGGCKGQGNGKFEDKNLAVKVATMKMAEKRNDVLNRTTAPSR